jgi:luciferase family oxidoreductase group 1
MLHALYPGRIDLGLGRAPGGRPLETYALQRVHSQNAPGDDFPQQLGELLAFLGGEFPAGHAFSRIHVSPAAEGGPEVWLLGSSMWSARAAAELGLPYAFAHFINPEPTRAAIRHYRSNYEGEGAPRVMLGIGAIVADTEAEAQRLYTSRRLLRILNDSGYRGPLPSPEEAIARLGEGRVEGPPDRGEWPRYLVGDPEQVHRQTVEMMSELEADELIVVTVVHDHQARLRSYALLAESLGLVADETAAPKRGG